MDESKQYHAVLAHELEQAGLNDSGVPDEEAWRAFLGRVSHRLHEAYAGTVILDERFDKMIRHAVDPFFLHDTEGRVIEVNHAACEMLGYTREELLEMGVGDFEMDLAPGAIWDRMRVDEVFTVEGRHRSKGGRVYPVETRVGAFMAGGRKVILALCRDVSERVERARELEELNQALERARDEAVMASSSKSAFLADMSHELRTPLNAVIGYSEFVLEQMQDEGPVRYRDELERIRVAGQHMLSLINDVLDLSKIEAGKLEARAVSFDLSELLGDVESTAEPLAMVNGNRLEVACAPGAFAMHTDATKLRQILLNLLGNACKFTEGGEVGGRATSDEAGWVELQVWDTGVGMSKEALGRVFEAFEQADEQTEERYGGTGLGLTLTERFCRLLGGRISVRSQPGEGTEFRVRLPQVLPELSEV
ncbi:PAS domain-containing sensor histidine kinase [Bradymonadaceae bacterium TMQ3]|nr:PAS domain-containing sensor histidine kinase [Bradymonadaceae bacterium TMQ3]TXC73178.1 PAS domain S-box protein [Bradymonadales bacterium TMQ1]